MGEGKRAEQAAGDGNISRPQQRQSVGPSVTKVNQETFQAKLLLAWLNILTGWAKSECLRQMETAFGFLYLKEVTAFQDRFTHMKILNLKQKQGSKRSLEVSFL